MEKDGSKNLSYALWLSPDADTLMVGTIGGIVFIIRTHQRAPSAEHRRDRHVANFRRLRVVRSLFPDNRGDPQLIP